MPKFDLALITTVEADNYDQACAWLAEFANGLADEHGMPFTAEYVGMPDFTLHGKERIIYLLPIQQGSAWEGPTQGPVAARERMDLPTFEAVVCRATELRDLYPSWRWGQALFNALVDFAPEAADEIRGTDADPFYTNNNVAAFWTRLGI